MSNPVNSVHAQVTDALTQVSAQVLGAGPVVALLNGYVGQAQAQAVLAANLVSQQQQQALVGMAVTMRNVRKLLGGRMAAQRAATCLMAPPPAPAPNAAPQDGAASLQGPGNLPVW